eukprot:731561-Hanusia_phi.AAC.1
MTFPDCPRRCEGCHQELDASRLPGRSSPSDLQESASRLPAAHDRLSGLSPQEDSEDTASWTRSAPDPKARRLMPTHDHKNGDTVMYNCV